MNEILLNLSKVLPQLAIIAAICGFLGWFMRGLGIKPAPVKSVSTADKGQQDRLKKLEDTLDKSKTTQKLLKAELDHFRASSVTMEAFESTTSELEATRKSLETEAKRNSTLEADLKKSQDTIRNLNSRANDADKLQKDRSFALENELSKTREQLSLLQERPDDSTGLLAEIERLREAVATSTRSSGELRKREIAAAEELERTRAQLAALSEPGRTATPAAAKKIGPIGDSERVAAAKAEVLRLLELNKQKDTAVTVETTVNSGPEISEETAEKVFVSEQTAPIEKKQAVHTELFSLD